MVRDIVDEPAPAGPPGRRLPARRRQLRRPHQGLSDGQFGPGPGEEADSGWARGRASTWLSSMGRGTGGSG